MQRWQLTAALAGTAVLAAMLVPRLATLLAQDAEAQPNVEPTPEVVEVAPEPIHSGHVTVTASLDRTAVLAGGWSERYLTITATGEENVGQTTRVPVDVAVVMDTSGSMAVRRKISYAKLAAREVVAHLEGADRFSLVGFAADAYVPFRSGQIELNRSQAYRAIDSVVARGNTNLYAGIEQAARQLAADGDPAGRILVLSDGIATSGITDPGAIRRLSEQLAERGVAVSTVGLGNQIDEDMLARVAFAGGGRYSYVDDANELAAVFSNDVEENMRAVARELTVSVAPAEGIEVLEVIGWPAQRTANGLSVRIGDLAAGQTRKIVARVRVRGDAEGTVAIGDVDARWQDLVDDGPGFARLFPMATITEQVAMVESSVDATAALVSAEVVAADYMTKAASAYQSGKTEEAQKMARRGQAAIASAPMKMAPKPMAKRMKKQAERLERREVLFEEAEPASDMGRAAILEDKADSYEALAY
jgi:Ca-activated chloride channel family protein